MNLILVNFFYKTNQDKNQSKKTRDDLGFLFLLFAVIILAYGILTFRQGFYLDDWYIILFKEKLGNAGFSLYFSKDRPFLSYPYVLLMSVFQESAIGWSIFALIMRWIATCSFWILLNKAYPEHKTLWKWAAIIFAVYPGFKFHWFAIMYSFAYIFLTFYFLSYYFMLKAIEKTKQPGLYILSTFFALVSLAIGIIPQEYFYGMELFRPIFLFLVINKKESNNNKNSLIKAFQHWVPYLILFIGFTAYRVIYSHTYAYQVGIIDQLRTSPLLTINELVIKAVNSVNEALVISWWNALNLIRLSIKQSKNLLPLLIALMGFGLVLVGLYPRKHPKQENERLGNGWKIMIIGLYLSLVALVPFYAGGFDVGVEFPWNRFLLALTPGVAIFSVGFIELIFKKDLLKVITLAFLCSIAIGSQFITSTEFVHQWEMQKDFFWQLTWRVPQLKTGTTLITAELPFAKYFSGTSLIGPLNIIYFPEDHSTTISSMVRLMDSPESKYIPEFAFDKPILYNLRGLQFEGNTNQLLLFTMPEDSCLRVLGPNDLPDESTLSKNADFWRSALPFSNLNTIITNPPVSRVPQEKYFGIEDTNQWCYFFEKADLARQNQDWKSVVYFYESAQDLDLSPYKIAEYVPFLEAYIRTGDIEAALHLIDKMNAKFPNTNEYLCDLFYRLQNQSNLNADEQAILRSLQSLQCGQQ